MASIITDHLTPFQPPHSPLLLITTIAFILIFSLFLPSLWIILTNFQRRSSAIQHSSSSSQSPILIYDVFLSFRGDTRRGFTRKLYKALHKKGINAFMDDSLKIGIDMSQQLLTTIEQSRFAIVVFSQNFTSSGWCLKELLHIVNSKNVVNHRTVFPVFYDVTPNEVRYQTGMIGRGLIESARYVALEQILRERGLWNRIGWLMLNLSKHITYLWMRLLNIFVTVVLREVMLNEWRQALRTVANMPGCDVRVEFRDDDDAINSIATKISNLLKHYEILIAGKDLVGIGPRVDILESRLALESNDDVRFIGIWGMIGSGKTTIAGELLRKIHDQFYACCFVEGINKEKGGESTLPQLRRDFFKKLLDEDENILNYNEGFSLLRRLKNRKVLIILDDVANENQIENFIGADDGSFFGPGSRIILTTRDKHLIKRYCHVVEDCIYEVEKLNNVEAVELLRKKAFSEHHPDNDDYNLVLEEVARYTSGLPGVIRVLAREVLYGREVEIWEEVVQHLKKSPNDEIIEPFQAFIDKLDQKNKDIFLDIACFFNGNNKHCLEKIFESCDFGPLLGFNVLIEKALITIDQENQVMMYTLIKQIGWHIVRKKYPKNPGKQSRLWIHKDASNLLENSLGTTNVEGIFLTLNEHERLPDLEANSFKNMQNLRLLRISNVNFSTGSSLDSLSNNLRVLDWDSYPLHFMPQSFKPLHLVELNMPNSSIQILFSGNSTEFRMDYLRKINLRCCERLEELPNFKFIPNLEILVLEGCTMLREIHLSIRNINFLVELNLRGCVNLLLPPSLNNLGSLEDVHYISP